MSTRGRGALSDRINYNIKPGALQRDVMDAIKEYGIQVDDIIKGTADEVAEEAVTRLKSDQNIPVGRGKYRRSFFYEKDNYFHRYIRRIANKEYRLTHLLEYGHAINNGTGRTRAFPHWSGAEEKAVVEFERRVIERLSDI